MSMPDLQDCCHRTDLKAMKELAKADSTRLAGFDSSLESSQRTIQKNQASLETLAAEIKQLQVGTPPLRKHNIHASTSSSVYI